MTQTRKQKRHAKWLRRMHGCLAIVWFAMIPVSALTKLRSSVPFLIGISVYALAAAHFASWQSGRAETKDDDE